MNLQKYYAQLVGLKISGFHFENDEYAHKPFPVFTLSNGKDTLKFTLSMDREGNGGGFAFIEPAD